MENDLIIRLNSYFGQNGLIFHSKLNEYYKMALPKFDEIKRIYESIESNPQFATLENRVCYISCCLYFLSKSDESYKNIFLRKVMPSLQIKEDPINDSYLFLIYNCIDFDENFLHSDQKRLGYLSVYLHKFYDYQKERNIALLYKYYNAILNYRLGKREDAFKECYGISAQISEQSSDKIINFISLKNQIFLAKMSIDNFKFEEVSSISENFTLLKNIYDRVINENPFLALKIGFSIFNNLYNRNLYVECLQLLEEMYNILKNYERNGVPAIKISRFFLSVLCRFGLLGLILADIKYITLAIEGMTAQLYLLKEKINSPKVMYIFKAYTFSVTILKLNSGKYVEDPAKIGNIFKADLDNFNNEKNNFCINKEIYNQSLINYNALNKNLNISINEQSNKLVDFYLSRINKPEKNFISNDIVFTFVIGMHDRIKYLIEKYLTDEKKNENMYKNNIISNCETFWNFINLYVEKLPLLNTNFFKSIIIKLFSSCFHVYYINKDFNKMSQILNYFDNLSNKLSINENTPSYELVLKVRGDFSFLQNDYNNSICFYNHSVQLMNDRNPKKAIIYFNLGVLYYYNNDKNRSIENMQKAAEYFKKSEKEKYSFDLHKRNNNLAKKYSITNALINKIKSSA